MLSHESNKENGAIFEVGAGWVANVRWQRNAGIKIPLARAAEPEAYQAEWARLDDWSQVLQTQLWLFS